MNMCMLSEEVTNQLKKLSAREQELIHLNSKSLQASRMRDQQLKGQKHCKNSNFSWYIEDYGP